MKYDLTTCKFAFVRAYDPTTRDTYILPVPVSDTMTLDEAEVEFYNEYPYLYAQDVSFNQSDVVV